MSDIAQRAQGKWPVLLSQLGIPDEFLANKHGPCPLCRDGKDRYRFDNKEGRGTYYCNVCGSGDGFDLLMKVNGWDFRTAKAEVQKLVGVIPAQIQKPEKDPAIRLRAIARGAQKLTGKDPASEYLRGRGLQTYPPGLRFHSGLDYFDDGKCTGKYPAMLGAVQSPQGKALTWHVTYLDQGKKAEVPAPKKIMKAKGKINGAAIRLFPAGSRLGIAEGIETAIAAHEIVGIPTWAVLNTSGMQSFIWPDAVEELVIFADNDANYAGHVAAYSLAHRLSLDGKKVQVWLPQKNGDWLDVLNDKHSGTAYSAKPPTCRAS